LLYVGRLNVRKNIGNLLRALRLLEGDVKMPIVISGSPDWKNPGLASLLATLAIRPIFTGSVEDRDLPALYAMASVFCFPSYEEGFGLPPLEAMACGVPVVVSDRSSLPEVCGNAGTYANPDDPEAIATAIQSLLVDEGLALKKRALGLERAGHFSWQNSARGVMASITAAVGRTK
jgi:glycosyltransferase involved in cell wall biosynthesis